MTKRTKNNYLRFIKQSTNRKSGLNIELQMSEERAKLKSMLAKVQKLLQVNPTGRKKIIISMSLL